MESSDYKITLDLHSMSSPVSLNAKRGDSGRRICVTLMESGVPYSIAAGCYAVFTGKKPDDTILWNSCAIEGDAIIYEITKQTVIVAGIALCQVRLYGGDGKLISSPDFTLIVDDTVIDDGEIVSANEITALTELVADATTLIAKLESNTVKVATVSLSAANWTGEESPYAQVVDIEGVTEYSKVDLQPSIEQLAVFHDKDLAFVTENEDGVITVYALGDKPQNDYEFQATITETEVIS